MKMPEKLQEAMVAPCGVNCLFCSAHLSDKNPCPGCRAPDAQITRKSCRNCAKKKCARDRGLEWCFQCNRFPCVRIKSLSRRYLENYNIDLVQNGVDAKGDMRGFLQSQRKRFTCKFCGGAIDQHRGKCSVCGRS